MLAQKRDSFKILMVLFSGLSVTSAFSGSMGEIKHFNYFATLSAGPIWQNGGTTQTFYLAPELEKAYVANKSTRALADVELFLGLQKALNDRFYGQLGAAVGVTGDAKFSGVIWDDADPTFDNFTYSYKLQHTHLAIKGKLLAEMGYFITPWLNGSVGIGFNRSYSFRDIPNLFEAVANPGFSSNTKTSFTYTVGAGIQHSFSNNWQMGIGYEFADWGKSQLGRAQGQTMNSGLGLNHLYTNGFMANITYIV